MRLFRNAHDACSHLEHWWVEERYGSARAATGDRLVLAVDSRKSVVVDRRKPCAQGANLVQLWLRSSAEALLAARRVKAGSGQNAATLGEAERDGVLPETIEGLIAYLGFSA